MQRWRLVLLRVLLLKFRTGALDRSQRIEVASLPEALTPQPVEPFDHPIALGPMGGMKIGSMPPYKHKRPNHPKMRDALYLPQKEASLSIGKPSSKPNAHQVESAWCPTPARVLSGLMVWRSAWVAKASM
jgi:hypothetical protein